MMQEIHKPVENEKPNTVAKSEEGQKTLAQTDLPKVEEPEVMTKKPESHS